MAQRRNTLVRTTATARPRGPQPAGRGDPWATSSATVSVFARKAEHRRVDLIIEPERRRAHRDQDHAGQHDDGQDSHALCDDTGCAAAEAPRRRRRFCVTTTPPSRSCNTLPPLRLAGHRSTGRSESVRRRSRRSDPAGIHVIVERGTVGAQRAREWSVRTWDVIGSSLPCTRPGAGAWCRPGPNSSSRDRNVARCRRCARAAGSRPGRQGAEPSVPA